MSFTLDDLFADVEDPFGGPLASSELRSDLIDSIRRGVETEIDDLDAAIALTELLQSEYMAFGTGGGERLADAEVRLVHRALNAVLDRLGLEPARRWRDFTSFRAYWLNNGGHGSWAARRAMVSDTFAGLLDRLYARQDAPSTGVVAAALNALGDASAIHDHLRRLNASVDSDPRLAVAVAKDLVESTAKLVLRERGESISGSERLPSLVARSQEALKLHAAGVDGASEEAQALRTVLGSLARLTQGVTELRNQVGVGHGRTSVPEWVRPRHARLAAGAATTWCNLMLETLGDPSAPWRRATGAQEMQPE